MNGAVQSCRRLSAMKTGKLGRAIRLVRHTAKEWKEHDAARRAAALAYYTALSIAPLLLISIWVAGLVFGASAARGRILGQISAITGHSGTQTIESMVESAKTPHTGFIASVLGGMALLFGAAGVFGELKESLNAMWENYFVIFTTGRRAIHSAPDRSRRPCRSAPLLARATRAAIRGSRHRSRCRRAR